MHYRVLNKKQRSENITKAADYWSDARKYVKIRTNDPENPPWFSVAWEDEARWKWELYFAWRLGFMPAGMGYLRQGTIPNFLVPCERPEDFDPDYKPKEADVST